MNRQKDTIAAVSSGMTASGIGIIRISGPGAFAVLGRIFRPKRRGDPEHYRTNTIHYGHIVRPDGEFVCPDGEVVGFDGEAVRPDEEAVRPEGEAVRPDEEAVRPDGEVVRPDGEVLDECLVMAMRGPHTYTTEDTVEINCHGGPYVMQRVLEVVFENGARPAEPGEFTKRAFLGGRIDLSEAEAVMDVISARSDDALKSSLLQLSGSVRRVIEEIRGVILDELSYIEAALDDPEHMDLTGYPDLLESRLSSITEKLERLSRSFGEGRRIREGILTVILGRPNAGKSSLLNALTGEDRAIVTDIEGTTRDILEEQVRLGGISLRIIDTAGIREAKDAIERIGIGRAREYAANADLLLPIFDMARPLDENDIEILRLVRGRKAVILLNKSDLEPVVTEDMIRNIIGEIDGGAEALSSDGEPALTSGNAAVLPSVGEADLTIDCADGSGGLTSDDEDVLTSDGAVDFDEASISEGSVDAVIHNEISGVSETFDSGDRSVPPILRISAKNLEGLKELEEAVRSMFFSGGLRLNEEIIITNARHYEAIRKAGESLALVRQSIVDGMPEDFFSIDLMDAYRSLGEILGEEVGDDLVDNIFSKFCMGK